MQSSQTSNVIIANAGGTSTATASIGTAQVQSQAQDNGGGDAASTANAVWFTSLIVTSSTLAAGTPTQVTLTAHYTGTLGLSLIPSGFPVSHQSGSVLAKFSSTISTNAGSTQQLNYSANAASTIDQTISEILDTQVGAVLTLNSSIDFSGMVSGGFKETGIVSGDLSSTFAASSSNPNITLVRAASVPAPGSVLVLGGGFLFVPVLLRRRRCSKRTASLL